MSEELEKKIDKLEELIEKLALASTPSPSTNSDLKRYVGPIITILVLTAGIVATWATNNYALAEIQKDLTKVVQVNEKQEETIQDIKLKAVQESSDLKGMKEDVAEIKVDVKKLLEAN